MAGVDDRRFDVKDILTKVTTGWITPPNEPTLIVEDKQNRFSAFFGKKPRNVPTNGIFFIKKEYTFNRVKHSYKYENRLWELPCTIIIAKDFILLQGVFDQAREVFDRYTSAPWSTSTLGTSTTYRYAGIESGTVDSRHPYYVMDVIVHLLEQFVSVVIA